jgi:hypothetical protein
MENLSLTTLILLKAIDLDLKKILTADLQALQPIQAA